MKRHRCHVLSAVALILVATGPSSAEDNARAQYQSPYSVKFVHSEADLLSDLRQQRGDPKQQSTVPFADWASEEVRRRFGRWGPPARHYPPPEQLAGKSRRWQRERVLATALRFVGYAYEHHHIPDWDPPVGWPSSRPEVPDEGKGLDCSNFTAFAFNQGLGITFTGHVQRQSEMTMLPSGNVQRLPRPVSLAEAQEALRPADLLFIKNNQGEIGHVVFWVGDIGRAPDQAALILDSTGDGHRDSGGKRIPDGVFLRPIRERSWYFGSLSHVLRLIPDD